MPKVEYDDLDDHLQEMIAQLRLDVDELKFESNIYRWVSLAVILIVVERIWDRFF